MTHPLTNCHQGERFFIGGSSDHINKLDHSMLQSGRVIGLNQWCQFMPHCDYWLCVDSDSVINKLPYIWHAVPRHVISFMQQYNFIPPVPTSYSYTKEYGDVPLEWTGKLSWINTSAVAAINLAAIMGASEIVLFGVDMTGGKAFGLTYDRPDHWDRKEADGTQPLLDGVNKWLHRFVRDVKIPVYKLNPDSPIAVPLHPELSVKTPFPRI